MIGDNAQTQFSNLIDTLATKEKVIILIDEYDKPILGNVTNPKIDEILKKLKGFFSVVKGTEPQQRFVLLTGVSKFSHVSVFSDLNNLTDITMEADFATMLGYTQEEVEYYLGDRIEELVEKTNFSKEEMLAKIKLWYNGYRFHPNAKTVYNPVSLALFFRNGGEFSNYWFKTGTTSFLLELLKKSNFDYNILTDAESSAFFDSFEISQLKPKVLLYQTGYLTIDRCEQIPVPYSTETMTSYYLHFPNLEVQKSFIENLLEYYADLQTNEAQKFYRDLLLAVGNGNADDFMKRLKVMFANIPYTIRVNDANGEERYYQAIFYGICLMLRLYVQAEVCTNDGRIDMVIHAGNWIYVIEFKLNQSAEKAMTQIKSKDYPLKYQFDGKRIMLIGVNFDSKSGQIENWISEEVKN